VVDDCSSDRTKQVVESYCEERIEYIQHNRNRGACAARNTGIKAARGDYIAFLDSDDEWMKTKLEQQVERMEHSPQNVGVIYTGYKVSSADYEEIGQIPTKSGDIFRDQLMKDWVSPTSTVLVRSECFEQVGDFNTELSARQDYEMWTRIARKYHFDFVSNILVTLHSNTSNRLSDNISSRMSAHKSVLDQFKQDIDELSFLSRQKSLSYQYFTMGRYLQKNRQFSKSQSYFLRSTVSYPLNLKALLSLFLAAIGIDTTEDWFIKSKNLVKSWVN
jgi:glycosyltransferase involved in cell wall biosynthesis